MGRYLVALLLSVVMGCAPAPTSPPTLSAEPPMQVRCAVSAPGRRVLIVVRTSPSNSQVAQATTFCTAKPGADWVTESPAVSTDGYTLICEGKPDVQVVMGVWSMTDEATLGRAYNVCGVFKNVTFARPR